LKDASANKNKKGDKTKTAARVINFSQKKKKGQKSVQNKNKGKLKKKIAPISRQRTSFLERKGEKKKLKAESGTNWSANNKPREEAQTKSDLSGKIGQSTRLETEDSLTDSLTGKLESHLVCADDLLTAAETRTVQPKEKLN